MCHFGWARGAISPTVCVSHSWQWQIIKVDLTCNVGRSHPLPFLHPLVSERGTWQGVPSASISSGTTALSPPPQTHLGPAVVSSSPLFGASVQRQMTALISLTQTPNKTTGVQKGSTRRIQTHKHTRSVRSQPVCLPYSLTLNLTQTLSLTLMRSGKCLSLLGICPVFPVWASLLFSLKSTLHGLRATYFNVLYHVQCSVNLLFNLL